MRLYYSIFNLYKVGTTGPPNMSQLLDSKSIPSFIIKPRLILVAHTDDLGWYYRGQK